jgi:hypothetical protein
MRPSISDYARSGEPKCAILRRPARRGSAEQTGEPLGRAIWPADRPPDPAGFRSGACGRPRFVPSSCRHRARRRKKLVVADDQIALSPSAAISGRASAVDIPQMRHAMGRRALPHGVNVDRRMAGAGPAASAASAPRRPHRDRGPVARAGIISAASIRALPGTIAPSDRHDRVVHAAVGIDQEARRWTERPARLGGPAPRNAGRPIS